MPTILSERCGAVATITLNNAAQYNAMTWDMLQDLNRALKDSIAASDVRCIVLTGAGKGFCAGAQLGGKAFGEGGAVRQHMREAVSPLIATMRSSPIPIVVAVNGPAAGAGVGLALAGDIVIAARSAKFILSFVKLGAVLDAGTSLLLQRSIGAARARALALTGEGLSAETAAQWGLIWSCVDDALLMNDAMAIAEGLASGPPRAISMIKQQLEHAWSAPLDQSLELEAALQGQAFATKDLREGATAFLEKRAARFTGE